MPVLFSNVGAFGTAIATATLAITGYAPTISVQGNADLSPGAGSGAFTGHAPAVYIPGRQAFGPGLLLSLNLQSSPEGIATPAAYTATITGYAPTLDNPDAYTTTEGSDDLTAEAATTDGTAVKIIPGLVDRFPPAGSGVFTGYAPVALYSVHTGAGAATFAGHEPSLRFAAILPATGAVSLTGYAPDLLFLEEQFRSTPKGSGAFTGYAPTLAYPVNIPNGAGTFASNSFTLNIGMPLPAASGTFTGYAPTVVATGVIFTGSGTMTARRATTSAVVAPVIDFSATLNASPATLTDQVFYVRLADGDLQAGAGSFNTSAITFNAVLTSGRASMYAVGLVLPAYQPVKSIAFDAATNKVEFSGTLFHVKLTGTVGHIA